MKPLLLVLALLGCSGYQLQPSVKTVRFMPEADRAEPTNGVALEFELVPPLRLADDQMERFERILSKETIVFNEKDPVPVVVQTEAAETTDILDVIFRFDWPQVVIGSVLVLAVAFLAWTGQAANLPVVGKWFAPKEKKGPKKHG